MAGHNKWSKIKHRKAVVDKRRAKAWTMCSRLITTAARAGGGDPAFNASLRTAIDEARYHNVPSDNIERAIKKGVGGGQGDDYEPVRYEGYGAGGVAVIVDALTNNRTRTAADVRLIFAENEGKFGAAGCVAHQFEHTGRIVVSPGAAGPRTEDEVFEAALAAGADDVRPTDEEPGSWDVLAAPTQFLAVKAGLAAAGLRIGEAELEMVPGVLVQVAGDHAKSVLALVEALEDNEDVKKVWTNADIPDEVIAALEG